MERLNKYLAHAGIGSRRHCDELIAAGRVKIDGRIVRDLGVKVDIEKNKISVDDNNVRSENRRTGSSTNQLATSVRTTTRRAVRWRSISLRTWNSASTPSGDSTKRAKACC